MKAVEPIQYYPLGDSAIVMQLGNEISETIQHRISSICDFLEDYSFEGFIEYVPAFTTVTIFYDALITDYQITQSLLQDMMQEIMDTTPELDVSVIEIPVLYGGTHGPDLSVVAAHSGISENEVVALHTAAEYLVYMIGFAPGFPYLGGMNEQIATPRKETPRPKIAAGSVGIAGAQTGIYPIETPGGWQIIGQTPLKLFDLERASPALLKAGNKLRFSAISEVEFEKIRRQTDGD